MQRHATVSNTWRKKGACRKRPRARMSNDPNQSGGQGRPRPTILIPPSRAIQANPVKHNPGEGQIQAKENLGRAIQAKAIPANLIPGRKP